MYQYQYRVWTIGLESSTIVTAPKCPYRLCGPSSYLFSESRGSFPGKKDTGGGGGGAGKSYDYHG
jgi:hypothetical protein